MDKCIICNHFHSNYDGKCFESIKGNCECDAESYRSKDNATPGYSSIVYHTEILEKMKTLEEKIGHILTAIEGTRNMTNWEFIVTCWRYFFGFRLGDYFDQSLFEKIGKDAEPENIRRCRQKICHHELETLRNFQDLLQELKKEKREGRPEYHYLEKQLKQFWINSKYIPNDISLIKKKGIKESAILEWSIQEIEDTYFILPKRSVA